MIPLRSNAKVVLQTEKSTLCIEKLNDSHGVINGGCNTYKIRFAIIEMAFGTCEYSSTRPAHSLSL